MAGEFQPFEINGTNEDSSPWEKLVQHPMTLINLWPDDEPPTATEVTAAIANYLGVRIEVIDEIEDAAEDVLWNRVIEVESLATPMIIWVEPSRPLPAEIQDDALHNCPWALGTETILDPAEPLSAFATAILMTTGPFDQTPGVLDVNTGMWHPREELEDYFLGDEADPPTEVLWVIHAVSADDRDSVWLHTHGLWRCGRPELEMLEVPSEQITAAGEMLNGIAELLLEHELPPPEEPFEIGMNLVVTAQPWQEIAPYLEDGVPGGMHDRKENDENPHCGIRAVICAPEPVGTYRRLWGYPQQAVDQLLSDDATLFRSQRETDRITRLAQRTWPQLATAFASLPKRNAFSRLGEAGHAAFLIKAAFEDEREDSDGREHVWFEIERIRGDHAQAKLINQPITLTSIREGNIVWISREQLTDWVVFTPAGRFSPSNITGLWRAIDALREENA